MTNIVILEGYVNKDFKKFELNGKQVIEFTFKTYTYAATLKKSVFVLINCKAFGYVGDYFELNKENLVNKRSVIYGCISNMTNEEGKNFIFVKVDGIIPLGVKLDLKYVDKVKTEKVDTEEDLLDDIKAEEFEGDLPF